VKSEISLDTGVRTPLEGRDERTVKFLSPSPVLIR